MLVGSLSGHPISRLVAGPVAQLIAEQIPNTKKMPEEESAAVGANERPRVDIRTASALPAQGSSGSVDGGANYRSVVDAYGEF